MDIEIVTGFLGAGKTTFLNQYLMALTGKMAVIENEFGDIGLDGERIKSDVPVTEINAGCICCSLVSDFCSGIKDIARDFQPERLLIEPSGVGKLSDIIAACEKVREREGIDLEIKKLIVLVDAESFEDYYEDFGEFYLDQIKYANLILLSHIDEVTERKKQEIIGLIQKTNSHAILYDGDVRKLEHEELLELTGSCANTETHFITSSGSSTPGGKVFSSKSIQLAGYRTAEECEALAGQLKSGAYGQILRVKGMIPLNKSEALHIDITHSGSSREKTNSTGDGKIVIIGCDLQEEELERLFRPEERED